MPRNDKNHAIFCAENVENHAICCAENVENHAIFVEGFWPDFYARGRFMKNSMSVITQLKKCVKEQSWAFYKSPLHSESKKCHGF